MTLNAGPYFASVLDAIRAQASVSEVRVTVVDSQSDDDTQKIARRAGARVIEVGRCRFNHGLTRNFAVAQTTSDVAVLMTQDALLAHGRVFANLLRHFENPRVAGASGRQVPRSDLDPIANARWRRMNRAGDAVELQELGRRDWVQLAPHERMQLSAFDDVCSAIRRRVWERIPFRRVPFAEDRVWARDVLLAGHALVYDPEATVVHSHAPTLRGELARIHVNHLMMYRAFGWEPATSAADLVPDIVRATIVSAVEAARLVDGAPGRSRIKAAALAPVVETLRALWGYAGTRKGRALGAV